MLDKSDLVLPPDDDVASGRPSIDSVTGYLRGRASGRQWAFLSAFMLNARVRPGIEALAEPHRSHVCTIVDDAADALHRWWMRP